VGAGPGHLGVAAGRAAGSGSCHHPERRRPGLTEPRTHGRRARPPGPGGGAGGGGARARRRAAGGGRAGRRRRVQQGARREPLPGFAGLVRPAVLRTAQAGEGQGWLLRRHSTLSSEPGDVCRGHARGQGEAMPAVSRFQTAAVGDAVYIHTHRSLEDVLVLDVSDPGAPKLASRPVTGAQGTPMSRRGPFAERRLCLSAWL